MQTTIHQRVVVSFLRLFPVCQEGNDSYSQEPVQYECTDKRQGENQSERTETKERRAFLPPAGAQCRVSIGEQEGKNPVDQQDTAERTEDFRCEYSDQLFP